MMYALTLWQPYAWAIPYFKDFENRTWAPPSRLLGEIIAIHAAMRRKPTEERAVLEGWGVEESSDLQLDDMPRGAVTAVARVRGFAVISEDLTRRLVYAATDLLRRRIEEKVEVSAHALGQYAIYLEPRDELKTPVPCRGYQRLWRLPPDVESKVRAQI